MNYAHPYEEVAHDIYPITNANQDEGAGMIGELDQAMKVEGFLTHVKSTFNCGVIRHTELIKKEINTVAFCGGSGSFLLNNAKSIQADIYINCDFNDHEILYGGEAI